MRVTRILAPSRVKTGDASAGVPTRPTPSPTWPYSYSPWGIPPGIASRRKRETSTTLTSGLVKVSGIIRTPPLAQPRPWPPAARSISSSAAYGTRTAGPRCATIENGTSGKSPPSR